jgi:anti-sigma B factor antagonist
VTLFEIKVDRRDGLAHLALSGELDLSTVKQLEQELARIESEGPATIALDLKQLSFLDSSGLRVVVGADQRARREGRRLVVVRGPATVQRIFSITRLDEQLEMVNELPA